MIETRNPIYRSPTETLGYGSYKFKPSDKERDKRILIYLKSCEGWVATRRIIVNTHQSGPAVERALYRLLRAGLVESRVMNVATQWRLK